MPKIRKAVVPAAGLGTRFLPATKSIPKEMLPIVNKPSIQLIMEEAAASGIEQVVIVTGRGKTEIVDHFDAHAKLEESLQRAGKDALLQEVVKPTQLVKIATVRQQRPLGLGHAILCARELIGDEPFVVFLPDDLIDAPTPCARQLMDVYERTGKSVVALMDVPREETFQYGIAAGRPVEGQPRELAIHQLHAEVAAAAPAAVAQRICEATGLKAYTKSQFFWITVWWFIKNTGIPVAFSGGVGHAGANGTSEAEVAAHVAEKDFHHPLRWLESESRDTRENAQRSVALLRQVGVRHLVVVQE